MKRIKGKAGPDTPVTEEVLAAAIKRGKATAAHQATKLSYSRAKKALHLLFADRFELGLPVERIPEFAGLSVSELEQLRLTPGGTVIELEKRDLHVSIPGLLASMDFLGKLAASAAAIRAGRTTSEAKARAAQENGRRGGRRPGP